MDGQHPVSSSRIRSAVAAGDLESAALMLGRKVSIDLTDMPCTVSDGFRISDTRSAGRVIPPSGSYQVIVSASFFGEGIHTNAEIKDGKILVPAVIDGRNVEGDYIIF
jgi:FAD synthase